ncbi:hypothetical protein ACE41H_18110 [Paenibacillus enshidis]|uniref:Uncharacterized protein n=1 Tax=Paenibacillus enshidis TaxID=1458439 RepID=A0ABV5AWU7_9BACL
MKIIYRVKWLFICFILLSGCQKQSVLEIRDFYATGPDTFSVFSVVKDEAEVYIAEVNKLNEFFQNNVMEISAFGVHKASSPQVKKLIEEYDIQDYPTYLLFDSEKLLLKETDYNKFEMGAEDLMD